MDTTELPHKRSRKPSKGFLRSKGLDTNSEQDDPMADVQPDVHPQQTSGHPSGSEDDRSPDPPSPSLSRRSSELGLSLSFVTTTPASTQPSTRAATPDPPGPPMTAVARVRPTSSVVIQGSDAQRKAKFETRYSCSTKSNSEVLNLQIASWKSTVYSHFKMPPDIIQDAHGNVQYSYKCLTRPSIAVTRARHDESTSNLKCHVQKCTPADSSEVHAIKAYAHGSSYNEATHRMKISLWVSRRNRPFAIVEDKELLDIFHDLNSLCITPKRRTVSRDVTEIFLLSRKNVGELLRAYPGKLHICADGWTSPNVFAFIGATVHWIINGKMVSAVLDFIKAPKAHTGVYLAARLAECFAEYGIQDKILGFVADNASNNDTLVKELENIIPSFKGPQGRVRCFAHIMNLIVKAILSQFSSGKSNRDTMRDSSSSGDFEFDTELDELEAERLNGEGLVGDEDPGADSDDELAPDVVASDAAAVDDIISEAQLSHRLSTLRASDARVGCMSIAKLQTLATKIVNSPTLREDLAALCKVSDIPPKLMVRDVATRWNSTAELIKRALELKKAINAIVIKAEHNRTRGVRLRRFRLLENEWVLLGQLSPLLEVFLYATKCISKSSTPLLHEVIPMIDGLTSALDNFIDNAALHPIVRHAALRGLLMLNKYYARTDESILYRVAMILHPRYKSTYFSKAGWLHEWVDEAERLARKEWEDNYRPAAALTTQSSSNELDASSNRFASAMQYFDMLQDKSTPVDAFDEWLSTAVVNTGADPITYWTGQASAGHPLARMALDFLSIPASSTDVERSFSKGGHTVSRFRHSLSNESTRASSVVGTWTELEGAIPRDEIVTMFKNKRKRDNMKKRQKVASDSDIEIIE